MQGAGAEGAPALHSPFLEAYMLVLASAQVLCTGSNVQSPRERVLRKHVDM